MGRIKIKKGLNISLAGDPEQKIDKSKKVKTVALIGSDYEGMKPTMAVTVGDSVKLGQVLFTDKKIPNIKFTSPASGKVVELNRGEKRVFQSIVIEVDDKNEVTFDSCSEKELKSLGEAAVKEKLIESGLWTSLRERPFEKVANPDVKPNSIFVTAMDSNPGAPDIAVIIKESENDFKNGLTIISQLTEGNVFICTSPGANLPKGDGAKLSIEEFEGPHPVGNVGTHIHFLDPVSRKKTVWHINAQDVIAIGKLFTTGKISVDRIVALSGSSAKNPRLIKTRVGACLADLTEGEVGGEDSRIVSGSVLSGRTADGVFAYLGRYHQQISFIKEVKERHFMGWLSPGFGLFSVKNVVMSRLLGKKNFELNTDLNGGKRAIVPIGSYEKVMPLDILPTYLLRSLCVDDVEEAESLGCLELSEEDLALCSFVCPSKINYGPILRRNLTQIEKEG